MTSIPHPRRAASLLRRALRAAAFCLAAAAPCSGAARAASLTSPDAVLGQWDMTLEGGARACRLTLRGERVKSGYYLGMPPGCRRAIPQLQNAVAWTLPGDDRLIVADVGGAPLLEFFVQPDATLKAVTGAGEAYRLVFAAVLPAAATAPPAALEAQQRRAAVAPAAGAPAAPAAGVAAPGVRRLVPTPAEIAGRYAVLRDGGRDTGCMVTLDPGAKAYLAPACRDQGIVTFDPTGWRLAGQRLVLVARKGHTTQLDLQPDGTWMKDAALGRTLGLKRL